MMFLVVILCIIFTVYGTIPRIELIDDLILLLPKLELHAHLAGSIRQTTMFELASAANIKVPSGKIDLKGAFNLFPIVHQVISTKAILKRVLSEVIEDYMAENTIYLELRTTPRTLPDGTTYEEYVRTLVQAINEHNIANGDIMLVKLILSIDRAKSFNEAFEVMNLAKSYDFFDSRSIPSDPIRIIVGVDFSGNPLGGTFDDFAPLFDQAKESGLMTTIHTAETKELSETISATFEEDETSYVISFGADRLGHALHLRQYHMDMLLKLKIKGRAPPIEICPTSNFMTLNLKSYADHPQFRRLFAMGYPISINTDDRGIFDTSLTDELLHVKNAFSLSVVDIIEILASTVDQTFAAPEEVEVIRTRFWRMLNDIANDYIDNKKVSQVMREVVTNRETKNRLAESNKKNDAKNEVDLTMYINTF